MNPSGGRYEEPRSHHFRYDGKDKSAWHLFMAERESSMAREKIGYLDREEAVNERIEQPVLAAYIPYAPGPFDPAEEPRAMREERAFRQRRAEKDYDVARDRWVKDCREVETHFGIATTILMQHVTDEIRQDLQTVQNTARLLGQTEQQKYLTVYQHLLKEYGPFSQKDVEEIRQIIMNISIDQMGVKAAMRLFKDGLLAMSLTPVRDANGNIMRELALIDDALLPPEPPGGANPFQIAAYWNALQALRADALLRQGPAITHRPTDMQTKTYLLDILSRTNLEDFRVIWVNALKPEHHDRTWQQIMTEIEILCSNENRGIDLGGPNGRNGNGKRSASTTRFIGMVRDVADLPEPTSSEKPNRHKRERSSDSVASSHRANGRPPVCHNCGRNHNVRQCTSTKCGHCGGRFETVEARKTHWGKWHSGANNKPPTTTSSNNDRPKSSSNTKYRSSSPYPRKSGYHSDNSRDSNRSNYSSRSEGSNQGKRHSSSNSKNYGDKNKSSSRYKDNKKYKRQYVVTKVSTNNGEESDSGKVSQGSSQGM